jgi:hypothetical protein
MGGGGMTPLGSYGGTQGVFNYGGSTPPAQTGFNQSQQNYIQSQGKLPAGLGGGALNDAQQNFFNAKGYLPKGFTGGTDLGQQYYRPQQQQQQYNPQAGSGGTPWQPYWSGGTPMAGSGGGGNQGGFNQNQLNYIQAQGKLPAAFGGGALNTAQQNFVNTKGYLPGGVTGDNIGQQYYRPQQQQQQPQQQYSPYGVASEIGQTFGNPYGGAGGYPGMQQLAGSNKPQS